MQGSADCRGSWGELLFTAKALPWAAEKNGSKKTDVKHIDMSKFLQSVKMLELDTQLGLVLD